jgi:hypothetical protein
MTYPCSLRRRVRAVANATFPCTRSSVLGWGGLLSRASRALIDTRPSYGPQRAPNPQLLSLPAGVRMLSRRGETAWAFHFGVLSPSVIIKSVCNRLQRNTVLCGSTIFGLERSRNQILNFKSRNSKVTAVLTANWISAPPQSPI